MKKMAANYTKWWGTFAFPRALGGKTPASPTAEVQLKAIVVFNLMFLLGGAGRHPGQRQSTASAQLFVFVCRMRVRQSVASRPPPRFVVLSVFVPVCFPWKSSGLVVTLVAVAVAFFNLVIPFILLHLYICFQLRFRYIILNKINTVIILIIK